MKPKQAFCVLKDVQQVFITHLDQETAVWWALAEASSVTERIIPAGQIFQTFPRTEKLQSLFYLSEQNRKIK